MEPWYKIVKARKEVREGRSFNPDDFAIALEQVVAGKAPEDYRDPKQFFCARVLPERVGPIQGWCCDGWPGKDRTQLPS